MSSLPSSVRPSRSSRLLPLLVLLATRAGPGVVLAAGPSLNINDPTSLAQATQTALTNLMTYYTPNSVRLVHFFALAFQGLTSVFFSNREVCSVRYKRLGTNRA